MTNPSRLPSRSILNRLGQMRRLNLFRPRQIRNRARQLQHAMERPRAHAELIHRAAHQGFAGLVQLAIFAEMRGALRYAVRIEAIEQRPADALLIARDHRRRARAAVRGIAPIAAGAGI